MGLRGAALLGISGLLLASPATAATEPDLPVEAESGGHSIVLEIDHDEEEPAGGLGGVSEQQWKQIIEKLDAEQLAQLLETRALMSTSSSQESLFGAAAFFSFVALVVSLTLFYRYRQSGQRQQTLRLMVEKGAAIPPELLSPPARPRSDLRRGLLLVALGAGLMVFLGQVADESGVWSLGLIPALLGGGYLLVWRIDSGSRKRDLE